MNHLTDEQLAAHLDGSGPQGAAEHLAACDECRGRLAELASLDEALGRALQHDPGEAYFASFADRVAARIAREDGPSPVRAPAAPRGLAAWWRSPRALAFAGGTVALLAVVSLAVVITRDRHPQPFANLAPPSEVGRTAAPPAGAAAESEAPRAAASPRADAARQPAAALRAQAPGAPNAAGRAREEAATQDMGPRTARPTHVVPGQVVQLKTLANGEQVPVAQDRIPTMSPPVRVLTSSGFAKPGAQSMAPQAVGRDERAAGGAPGAVANEPRTFAAAPPAAANAPVAASNLSESPAQKMPQDAIADIAPAGRVCGTVRDTRGRLLSGVVLSVAETGASTTSAADGTFCLEAPAGRPTLEAFSVGYRAYRGASDPAQPVALTLLPVETLAPLAGSSVGFMKSGSTALGGTSAGTGAPAAATLAARAASTEAARVRTVASWQHAAELWAQAEPGVAGSPADLADARFHVAEARVNAWRIGHTAAERAAADAAVGDYLVAAPAGPLRDLAEGWKKELAR